MNQSYGCGSSTTFANLICNTFIYSHAKLIVKGSCYTINKLYLHQQQQSWNGHPQIDQESCTKMITKNYYIFAMAKILVIR